MTTMLTYNWQGAIDFASLCFNPNKPEPLPDAMFQELLLQETLHVLAARFTDFGSRPDNFISSNTFICYDRSNLNIRVGPDCYLAFGVDARAIRERRLYLPWEVGKPPDLTLEIASETTALYDVTGKRQVYAQIGIPEYWRFDQTGGDYYGQALAGDLLVNGVYQPIDLTTEPDGVLKGYSPALELYFCWHEEWLYFYDPATGAYLRNREQELEAHQAERAAHQATQAELQAERAAREAAEAKIRELQEQLLSRRPED